MKVAVIYNHPDIKDSDVINVFGMRTKERYSLEMVEKVAAALEQGGHNVRIIEGNRSVIDELQQFMPGVVKGERPGMVFNMAYGIQGQSRYTHIPSLLEMLGIPYVGSGPAGHAIALDKVMTKIVFQRNNLPTPPFWVFSSPDEDMRDVHYPVIIKPRMEAVSFGLKVVDDAAALRQAVTAVTQEFEQQALVESFIPGREFAVALLGNGANIETLPIIEIDLEGDPNAIQTVDDKMQRPRRKICPADLPEQTAEAMRSLARGAFNALGLFDFARVDFRMDQQGGLHLLEINSMASLNLSGSFVQSAQVADMEFDALVNRILDHAAIRYFGESYQRAQEDVKKAGKVAEPLHIRVRSYIRSHISDTLDSTRQMVSIQSHVHNVEGVNTLGNWISARFRRLDFHRQVFPQTEVGHNLYFSNHIEAHKQILLLGHMDTAADFQTYVPFYEDRGRIYGTGVAESKGGIAVILTALQALRFARVLRNIPCGVLLTSDDALGGRLSKNIISALAQNSRCVIGTKFGDLQGGLVTSCSGTILYRIEISNLKNGVAVSGANVIEWIAQSSLSWQKLSVPEDGIEVRITNLTARTNPGLNSDHAAVDLDVRFRHKDQLGGLDARIRKIASKVPNGELQTRIRAGECRSPIMDSEANQAFFSRIQSLAEKLEIHVDPVHRSSSSDICHVPESIPVLGSFGPLGGHTSTGQEYIVRDSLIDRAALLALTVADCAR